MIGFDKITDIFNMLSWQVKQFMSDFLKADCPDCMESMRRVGEYDIYLLIKKRGTND